MSAIAIIHTWRWSIPLTLRRTQREEQAAVSAAIDLWILRGMGQWANGASWTIQIQARHGFGISMLLFGFGKKYS